MNNLEEAFADVIENLDLPEVDLTSAVLDGIESGPDAGVGSSAPAATTGAVSGTGPSRWMVMAAAATVVFAVGLALATTTAGRTVAAWFGIGATAFEVDEPGESVGAVETGFGAAVEPVPDVVPIESLGRPDAVFDDVRRGRTYLWTAEDGGELRLSARSSAGSTLAIKSLASADDVEFLTVEVPNEPGVPRPYPGVWIGAPHTLSYPVDGLDLELIVDAGPVLIWVNVDDDVELRLEGAEGKAEALRYATQISEGTELLPPG